MSAELNQLKGMNDGGERMVYDSGCLREPSTGKGRYDLISPFAFQRTRDWVANSDTYTDNEIVFSPLALTLDHINKYQIGEHDTDHLAAAARYAMLALHLDAVFAELNEAPDPNDDQSIADALLFGFQSISPFALERLAKWYELGALKYADRNWEKGMSYSRLIDSAKRHLNRHLKGDRTEDHLAAIAWNLFACMHYQAVGLSEYDDLPKYKTSAQESDTETLENAIQLLSYALAGGPTVGLLDATYNSYYAHYGEGKIIAVDFDGCLCENKWPKIGKANTLLFDWIKERQKNGDKIILFTCREGELLRKALRFCKTRGFIPDAVNENLPESIEKFGNDCRKVGADIYIDDRALRVAATVE